ncbi:MAG: hypothetical protein BWZ10_03118 [candidate division BRC1 bacterium ADurb.BinA364]|nr:MAG: hypothetical protein BWZ10_03118 [candidate division BRC1 bacterium ADurb.BinA364]
MPDSAIARAKCSICSNKSACLATDVEKRDAQGPGRPVAHTQLEESSPEAMKLFRLFIAEGDGMQALQHRGE